MKSFLCIAIAYLFLGLLVGYAVRGYVNAEIPRLEREEFCEWVMQPKQPLDLSRVIRASRKYCGGK